MKNNPPSPRQTALNCLRSWHAGRSFAETLVDRECSRAALPPADRHLVQALVFSVLRNQTWLDHVIGTLRKGKLDVEARLILQLGLSQLFLLGMADHAAVYETVNLASVRLRGLVNAILRNALRREKTILEDREKLPLPIHYSTPAWLVRRWTEQMGPQMTRDLLRWNNTTPRLYVRANPLIPMKNIPASLAPLDEHPTTKICPGFIFAALRSSSAAIRTSWRSSSNCPAVSISFEIPVALILLPPDLMPEKAADQTG